MNRIIEAGLSPKVVALATSGAAAGALISGCGGVSKDELATSLEPINDTLNTVSQNQAVLATAQAAQATALSGDVSALEQRVNAQGTAVSDQIADVNAGMQAGIQDLWDQNACIQNPLQPGCPPTATPTVTPTPDILPSATPTVLPTATSTMTPTPTVLPSATPNIQPSAIPSVIPTEITGDVCRVPGIANPEGSAYQIATGVTVSGLPNDVAESSLNIVTNNGTDSDGVDHKNTLDGSNKSGLWIGEPGIRTVDDLSEADQSAWLVTPDVQKVFDQLGPSFWGTPEGGFNMFTGAGFTLNFQDVQGRGIEVRCEPRENHTYFVVLKGQHRDYATPADLNNQVGVCDYNPGYVMATRLPQGTLVSQDYLNQNVQAAHGGNTRTCGADGCRYVTVVFVDPNTGAWTSMEHEKTTNAWTLVKTNIK